MFGKRSDFISGRLAYCGGNHPAANTVTSSDGTAAIHRSGDDSRDLHRFGIVRRGTGTPEIYGHHDRWRWRCLSERLWNELLGVYLHCRRNLLRVPGANFVCIHRRRMVVSHHMGRRASRRRQPAAPIFGYLVSWLRDLRSGDRALVFRGSSILTAAV
jgi:hypothetical protein